MNTIPEKVDNPAGLHRRYFVTKVDEPTDPRATYFVLRLDEFGRDQLHVQACRAAARAYAEFVQSGTAPHLATIGKQLNILLDNFEAAEPSETNPPDSAE